jgi:hypothetical protein
MSTFEIHYWLKDDSHQMDAYVRNYCEAELLRIVNELRNIFGVSIQIETLAYEEGGLREIWKFASKNKYIMGLITGVFLNFLTVQINKDRELDNLQKEKLRLEIQEKRLQIKGLENTQNKTLSDSEKEKIVALFLNAFLDNHKLIFLRSHFYEHLNKYDKLTQIDTILTPDTTSLPQQKASVLKSDFQKFIILSNVIDTETIENASIEIISPVLKKGTYKWRGIFNGEIIDFSMKDSIFKESIFRQEISFTSGITIIAILNRHRKVDDMGEIVIFKNEVTTVLSYNFEGTNFETTEGKEYKKKKLYDQMQTNMFDNIKPSKEENP